MDLFLHNGPSIKDVLSQRRGFVQCGHFSDKEGGGSSDADIRTFWRKTFEFFEIYEESARTRERRVEPVRIFCGQEGGDQFFAIL